MNSRIQHLLVAFTILLLFGSLVPISSDDCEGAMTTFAFYKENEPGVYTYVGGYNQSQVESYSSGPFPGFKCREHPFLGYSPMEPDPDNIVMFLGNPSDFYNGASTDMYPVFGEAMDWDGYYGDDEQVNYNVGDTVYFRYTDKLYPIGSVNNLPPGLNIFNDGPSTYVSGILRESGTWVTELVRGGITSTYTFIVSEGTNDVSFSSNGSIIDTQTVDSGMTATSFNPVLDGYTFKGWYTDNTFSTLFDFSTPITADITLFAKWEGNFAFTSEPTADGTVTPITAMDGTVVFDASASNGSLIVWDFGDGTTATGMYQTHYYSQPGSYTVKLMVYNDDGKMDIKEYNVSIPDPSMESLGRGILPTIAVALVLIIGGGLVVRHLL